MALKFQTLADRLSRFLVPIRDVWQFDKNYEVTFLEALLDRCECREDEIQNLEHH